MNYPPQGPPPQGPPPGNHGQPQGYPGQWGPPPQQPPWPQQQWSPGPPPKKRNGWKWALGAVAVLAVIGVTAAVTISVTSGDGGGGDDPAPPGETYGLASADDTGPVNIITEDPSCAVWGPINDTFAAVQKRGWNRRDASIPASRWTPQQRAQFEEVAKAAREASERAVVAAKLTPHRTMRELYEQFIAYARAYSDSIPSYAPSDENLARVMTNSGAAIVYACATINYGSADSRGPLVNPGPEPSTFAPIRDPNDPTPFLSAADPVCSDWTELLERFDSATERWQALDSAIPASAWTPEQRGIIDSTVPTMFQFAESAEELARRTQNPYIQDFALLAGQYRRAYAEALPTYTAADSWLASTGGSVASIIYNACKADV